jgi:hypothetical protein
LISSPVFAEQRETFKRIANVKTGYTDHGAPKSFTRAQKMSQNKRQKMFTSSYHQMEHMKNLASLNRRMNEVGSKQDRKKNPFDPIGNPVFFFTKGDNMASSHQSISLNGFAKKIE